MRVLILEPVAEDVVFLREVLAEIGEGRYWNTWVNIEILEAASWAKASEILAGGSVDIVLLDLDLPDSKGIQTFRRAQQSAPDVPLVLLVGQSDEMLGLRLVRAGAQDFLVKGAVDCFPLAHAMRNAIERHRLLTAARAASTLDSLTGLQNRAGFLTAANRDQKLAESMGCRLMVLVAEARSTASDQQRDLAMIEAADHFRAVGSPADLMARIGPTRLAMTIFENDLESLEAARSRIHAALQTKRIRVGAAIFSVFHPAGIDTLLEQAGRDIPPNSLAAAAGWDPLQ
jgi:PleD family two-component response regulator